jgi:hypothetical protein
MVTEMQSATEALVGHRAKPNESESEIVRVTKPSLAVSAR